MRLKKLSSKKESSHPKGHSCPDRQKFDVHAGKCVDNDESVDDDSSKMNKSASNLKFPKVNKISGTAETSNLEDDSDIHVDMQPKADKLMQKMRNVNDRIQNQPDIDDGDIPGQSQKHEYKPFKAKHGGSI